MAHFSYKIGAISFPNEGTDFWAKTVAGSNAPAKTQRNGSRDRIIVLLLLECESRTDLHEGGLQDRSRCKKRRPNRGVPGCDGADVKDVVKVGHQINAVC